MANIFDIAIKKVREMEASIKPSIKKAIQDNEQLLLNIQTNEQMFNQGERSDGSMIEPAYTPFTVSIKKRKSQPTNRVTLRDTGKFYRSGKITAHNGFAEISFNTPYAKGLVKKYGKKILGIQQEFMEEFVEKEVLEEIEKGIIQISNK